jgi:lipopolysaccharide heptosyltransferase II
MSDWSSCKNILCIRADNMGDLLMSSPAIRALKDSFQCKITVLTSGNATAVANLIPQIDEVITFDLPWVKLNEYDKEDEVFHLIKTLESKQFDACVVFNVYSQNPLPAVMLAYMAKIPKRLAYCRENPYLMLTDWVPDREPFEFIRHQVSRDLVLVSNVGATTNDKLLSLKVGDASRENLRRQLLAAGIDGAKPIILLHPGVSDPKRKYPLDYWIQIAKTLCHDKRYQYLVTGSAAEKEEASIMEAATDGNVRSVAGLLELDVFAALIDLASLVISVNTGTVHLAAAIQTPVVVLYANSNPQHKPWMVDNRVLEYSIPEQLRSKNKVIEHVDQLLYLKNVPPPSPEQVVGSVKELLDFITARNSDNTSS